MGDGRIRRVRLKRAFYPWAVASLLCMVIIFLFSAQNAEASSRISGAITGRVFGIVLGWFGVTEITPFFEALEVFVRKSAHLLVFTILGFCVSGAVRQLTGRTRNVFLVSLCFCSFYAATDEFHQLFVPGRACMWQDWLIDTAGVLLGICVMLLGQRLISRLRRRRDGD